MHAPWILLPLIIGIVAFSKSITADLEGIIEQLKQEQSISSLDESLEALLSELKSNERATVEQILNANLLPRLINMSELSKYDFDDTQDKIAAILSAVGSIDSGKNAEVLYNSNVPKLLIKRLESTIIPNQDWPEKAFITLTNIVKQNETQRYDLIVRQGFMRAFAHFIPYNSYNLHLADMSELLVSLLMDILSTGKLDNSTQSCMVMPITLLMSSQNNFQSGLQVLYLLINQATEPTIDLIVLSPLPRMMVLSLKEPYVKEILLKLYYCTSNLNRDKLTRVIYPLLWDVVSHDVPVDVKQAMFLLDRISKFNCSFAIRTFTKRQVNILENNLVRNDNHYMQLKAWSLLSNVASCAVRKQEKANLKVAGLPEMLEKMKKNKPKTREYVDDILVKI